jgi:hypothetical protein
MSGSHGDLFHEIGKLVLAAHAGQAIDLSAKSEELAERYVELGMPADLIAKAIARSLGAISVSMAVVANGHHNGNGANGNGHAVNGNGHAVNGNGHSANGHHNGNGHDSIHLNGAEEDEPLDLRPVESQAEAASTVFPSGLRLAVLS